jgi:tight adherence protein B
MNAVIIASSGLCFFLAAYLPFQIWEDLLWRKKILGTRDNLKREYEDLFKLKSDEEVLREVLIWGFACALVVFLIMPEPISGAIVAAVIFFLGIKIPFMIARTIIRQRRIQSFTAQMVDALTLMANGLRSGLNVSQTLQIVVDEMPAPVSQEFGLVLDQNRIGVPLEVAFENLAKRINTEEIYIFSTSVNILRETGGNMAETFDTIVRTIRERMKLAKKINALTAQGRTAGVIVGLVPYGVAVMMYLIDPDFARPLFTTLPGLGIMFVVTMLVLLGLYIINRMVKIRV